MKPALLLIRHAQWRWDWVAASNGLGFHSPVEAARVLGSSIQKAEQARLHLARVLAKRGITEPLPLPDISTKSKAQAYIGLDMKKLTVQKEEFFQTVLPRWKKKAEERQGTMKSY